MDYIRKAAISFLSGLLVLSLLGFAVFTVAGQTIRNKETVKSWLDDSGFHDSILSSVTDQIDQQPAIKEADSVNPEIRGVIENTFDKSVSVETTNEIIDGFFNWLDTNNGEAPLDVNLKDTKQKLADNLAIYAADRVDDLPACTPVQLGAMSTGTNPLTVTCKPPSYSKSQIMAQVNANVLSSLAFLPDNYGVNEVNNSEGNWTNQARTIYKLSGSLPIFFVILFFICIMLLLFALRLPVSRVAVMAGWAFILSGIGLGILSLLLTEAPDNITNVYKNFAGGTVGQDVMSRLVLVIAEDIGKILRWYVGTYLLLGIVFAVAGNAYSKKNKKERSSKSQLSQDVNTKPPLL